MATMKSHLGKTIPEKMFRWENGAKKLFFWEKWGNCVRRAWDAWEMGQLRDSHAECVTVGRSDMILGFRSGQVDYLLPGNHGNQYNLCHGSSGQRLNWIPNPTGLTGETGHPEVCGGPCQPVWGDRHFYKSRVNNFASSCTEMLHQMDVGCRPE